MLVTWKDRLSPRRLISVGRKAGDLVAVQKNAAAGDRVFAANQVKQCRFPGAVRADDGVAFAWRDLEINALDDLGHAEVFCNISEFEGGPAHDLASGAFAASHPSRSSGTQRIRP